MDLFDNLAVLVEADLVVFAMNGSGLVGSFGSRSGVDGRGRLGRWKRSRGSSCKSRGGVRVGVGVGKRAGLVERECGRGLYECSSHLTDPPLGYLYGRQARARWSGL